MQQITNESFDSMLTGIHNAYAKTNLPNELSTGAVSHSKPISRYHQNWSRWASKKERGRVWVHWVCGQECDPATPPKVTTAQSLGPKVQHGSSHKQEILASFLHTGRKCGQVVHFFYSHWFVLFLNLCNVHVCKQRWLRLNVLELMFTSDLTLGRYQHTLKKERLVHNVALLARFKLQSIYLLKSEVR